MNDPSRLDPLVLARSLIAAGVISINRLSNPPLIWCDTDSKALKETPTLALLVAHHMRQVTGDLQYDVIATFPSGKRFARFMALITEKNGGGMLSFVGKSPEDGHLTTLNGEAPEGARVLLVTGFIMNEATREAMQLLKDRQLTPVGLTTMIDSEASGEVFRECDCALFPVLSASQLRGMPAE